MSDNVLEEIRETFGITQETIIEFKELYGFTFVFKKRILYFRDYVASAEISPLGIIYDENGEYYFAPIHRSVNISEVVKEYVKI